MRYIRIKNIDSPHFNKLWEIYEYSFPIWERRTLENQKKALTNENYHFDCYLVEDKVVGFICYWEFADYLFVEHYAMSKDSRGIGYGTKIMSNFIEKTTKTIILEIDEVVDETTERRLKFYKHLNFARNPYKHICRSYCDGCPDEKFEIMSYPKEIDQDFYNRFYADLGNVVMK